MARKTQLTIEQRAQIEILNKEGFSQRQIAKKLNVSRHGVQHALKRKTETGSNNDRERSGRRRVTSKAEDKHIVVTSKRNRRLTARELRVDVNSVRKQPVSLTTVKRRLRAAGLFGRVAAKKPLLRPVNKKKRLLWAKKHKNWTYEDWKRSFGLMRASLSCLGEREEFL